jgi:hypothetical protein
VTWPSGRAGAAGLLAVALTALLAVVLAAALAGRGAAGRTPWPLWAPAAGGRLPHGTVLLLRGTPHYWVADEAGVLHWAIDTRALAGRYVRWDDQREVTLPELERLPRGAPWLSAPLSFVRAAGRLYVVRWEAGLRWPVLLPAPSVEALAPFGISAEDVAAYGADRQTWERQFELSLDALVADPNPALPPPGSGSGSGSGATPPAPPTPTPVAPAALIGGQGSLWGGGERRDEWSGVGAQRRPAATYPVTVILSRPLLDPALGVVVGTVSYPSFPCAGQLGLLAAGADEVLLAERLTSGLERCTDGGRVTLSRRTDQRLFYTWTLPSEPLAVTGQLLRTESLPAISTSTVPAAGSTRRRSPLRKTLTGSGVRRCRRGNPASTAPWTITGLVARKRMARGATPRSTISSSIQEVAMPPLAVVQTSTLPTRLCP